VRQIAVFRRLVVVAACLVATTLTACRSEPKTASPAPSPSSGLSVVADIVRAVQPGHPVIFLGLDAADWSLLDTYMSRGVMPILSRLTAEGTGGRIKTISPPLSPLVWTTMMTGTSPIDHGILDFLQVNPSTGQKEPITSIERRVPAIWNMATDAGKRSAVFGLWATFPAEPIDGLVVSDRLFTFLYKEQTPPAGVVYPADREAWARGALTRAEQTVDYPAVHAYLPWLSEADYRRVADSDDPYSQPVSALRRLLIETTVYSELSLQWIREERPDLAVVYLQATDTIGHVFAPYAPPRQAAVSERDYERFSGVPEKFFHELDGVIGRYRDAAAANGAVLMLASDHGFLWGEGRPARLSSVATASAAKWHAQEGIYLLWGPGISAQPGHLAHGSVQQVCSTLLALLGLPGGRGIDQMTLEGAVPSKSSPADYAAHYQPAMSAASAPNGVDPQALKTLRSLGYISSADARNAPAGNRASTRTPASLNNEGVILKDSNRLPEAVNAFEKALQLDPDLASAQWNLSDILYATGHDLDRSDDLLLRALGGGVPDGTKLVIGRAMAYQRTGRGARSLALMTRAVAVQPREADLWLFRGRYRIESGDCRSAVEDFDRALALNAGNASAYGASGVARLCAGDRSGARLAFEHALRLDPAQPKLREYLADLK
jgi:Flp pilus assembly protein TadD